MATGRVGRPRLSEEALKQRTDSILDTTLDLVARLGADQVRLRDVANAADVSVGTLQHYFETRDRMLHAAFERHTHHVVATIEKYGSSGSRPTERILSLLDGVTRDRGFARRAALWVEFASTASRDPELRKLMGWAYESWRRMLSDAVDEGIEAGQFRPVLPTDTVVSMLLALIDGDELALTIRIEGMTRESIADQLRQVASRLLGID